MIRVHLITGFLGVGKTTAILHLLKHKPEHEKWAVLVNEFGEVGVDGAILESQGAVVREVPGGCLCCVSGLPFQMGLNMLIAREKPDVILIEPTGLGHPRRVLQTLINDHYKNTLELGAGICLLDARQLSQTRYTSDDTFKDQIQLADVLVANKTDLATDADLKNFQQWADNATPKKAGVYSVQQGELNIDWLQGNADLSRLEITTDAHAHNEAKELAPQPALKSDEKYRRLENHGSGHYSVGWMVQGSLAFDLNKLRDWLQILNISRVKALVNTDSGAYVLNVREGVLTEMPTRALDESRIELIAEEKLDGEELEGQLMKLIL